MLNKYYVNKRVRLKARIKSIMWVVGFPAQRFCEHCDKSQAAIGGQTPWRQRTVGAARD